MLRHVCFVRDGVRGLEEDAHRCVLVLTKNKNGAPSLWAAVGAGLQRLLDTLGPQASPPPSLKDMPVTSPGNGKHSHKSSLDRHESTSWCITLESAGCNTESNFLLLTVPLLVLSFPVGESSGGSRTSLCFQGHEYRLMC